MKIKFYTNTGVKINKNFGFVWFVYSGFQKEKKTTVDKPYKARVLFIFNRC
jgi:hypothetical protein